MRISYDIHVTRARELLCVLAALVIAFGAPGARAADMPVSPQRLALFWHKDTGTDPRFDLIALTSNEYARAPEIDRPAIRQRIETELQDAYAAIDTAQDIYTLRINARLSEYDPRAGGFFLDLFSGNSFIPLDLRDPRNARGAFDGGYELHFLNAPDFYFWPEEVTQAQRLMGDAGREPRVIVDFRVQPIAGQLVPPGAGAARRVWGRVIEARVEIGAATSFQRAAAPVEAADLSAARSQALDIISNPDDLTMAMLWHKIVDGPEPDWKRLVAGSDTLRRADVFARDEVEAALIADARAYYDRIDPSRALRLTVNAEVGPYDRDNAQYPIALRGAVAYRSDFPHVAYPDDAERAARRNAGGGIAAPYGNETTKFGMVFENGTDLPGFPADEELARAIGLNLGGRAEVVVRPVAAETIENRRGTQAEKLLRTRIEQIRVTDPRSGKLLHSAVYPRFDGEIAVLQSQPPAETFEGVDPYGVDLRGLRLGMTEDEAVAAAQQNFGDVRHMKDPPSMIRAFGDNREQVAIILDTDRKVKALNYVRTWKDDVAEQVLEAALTRYGRPETMGRLTLDPLTRSDRDIDLVWTTNARRVGGFTGRVWYWSSQKETKLYLNLEDKARPTYEPAAPVITLE